MSPIETGGTFFNLGDPLGPFRIMLCEATSNNAIQAEEYAV